MFYDDADQLREPFKDQLKVIKGVIKSKQYCSHVYYIWTVVDTKNVV